MKTLGLDESERARGEVAVPRPWLVRVGSAGRPLGLPELIPLDDVSRLVLGRMDEGRERRAPVPGRIEVPDPWMSGEHAEVSLTSEGWQLRDLGSSNGTLIWGTRRSTALLADGDLFETGGTFWLFRSMVTPEELPRVPADGVLGSLQPAYVEMASRLRRVARTRVPVMLLGATGTGKEVLARELHRLSNRTGPFVAINTAAIQKTLVASELFGVEKGAHSTADEARIGQIRAANGGTILLDEIGDMPLEVQVSLLRVLQESEVLPVGGTTPVKVDVRIVCATHQDLAQMVASGAFRADLYARIKGASLDVPTLEDRAEDLGLLIARFLARYGGEELTFSTAAYRALVQYHWPLNVRELEKVIETGVALATHRRIELDHLPREVAAYKPPEARGRESVPSSGDEAPDDALQREIVRLMTVHKGNVSRVARSMGRSRMQVHRWLKRLAVDPDQFRG
ncbi:sigma 54-interacting transcriptional regulator [Myxococcota bacterium]|nr:sigma 54-interacting transcriptional regulator [Myxococcota bacterium]